MLDVLTKGCNKFKVDCMETAIVLGSLVLILLCNISWHLYCKDEESKHKKVESLLNDKLISQHDELNLLTHKIKILEQHIKDVCSGDYLIKDVKGEFSVCNHDVFYSVYESADTPQHKTPIVLFDRTLLRDDVTDEDIANKITIINK